MRDSLPDAELPDRAQSVKVVVPLEYSTAMPPPVLAELSDSVQAVSVIDWAPLFRMPPPMLAVLWVMIQPDATRLLLLTQI
jgi:hypothetical protein